MSAAADVPRVAAPALDEMDPRSEPLPRGARSGIGLCLSGGGFRATLFHLGALWRMNELGLLARGDFRTVTSVSGGSIAAAHLATVLARRGGAERPLAREEWEREVAAPLRAFTTRDRRTGPFLKRLLPWNLWRAETSVEALARRFERELTPLRLSELPVRPDFQLLATDMSFGACWVFSKARMGDYQAGYMRPPEGFTLGRAAAASGCFPPVFGPLRLRLEPAALKGGSFPRGEVRDECLSDFRLTDGGDYDNMGLEPVWKTHAVVLVSDAGGLFNHESDRGLLWRIPRYVAIQERQARGLRKRWLIAAYRQGALEGAYWGVGGAASQYGEDVPGYSKALATEVIAEIRTDLDAFSPAEAAVLENHGYLVADAALRRHVPGLLSAPPAALDPPHPDWMPPGRGEEEIRKALAGSGKRKTWGRG